MRTLEEIQKILQSHKKELYKKFGVKRIGIFGSYSRGKQKETSDIDILVEFHRPIGFIKFIKLQEYLEGLLGVKVDLVTKKALKKQIRKQILQEVKYV